MDTKKQKNSKQDELDNLRKAMGTLPSMQPSKRTNFVDGCRMATVTLTGWPENPYKQIFNAATATWGDDSYEDKWSKVSVENRVKVVIAALSGNTLPQALEPISFQFRVNGISRSAFDQIARARIGATFFSSGVRDNNKLDASFIMPTELYNSDLREKIENYIKLGKDLYEEIINTGQGSWQAARAILPMGMNHPFEFSMTYLALKGQCSRRLKFCEQSDTVAAFWLVRDALMKKFPLLALYLRPGCDWSGKCQYHQAYSLSEMFGCLFAPCGRNKTDGDYTYATFNKSCSDAKTISKQLGIYIPGPNEQMPKEWKLDYVDAKYFMD